MRPIEQLELPLWSILKDAIADPIEADMGQLLAVLDESLSALDTIGQLRVAAEAIAQIVQVFQERSLFAFEELEATTSDAGPVMPTDAFDRYVRQTMAVDFETFIEPLVNLPRKVPERQSADGPDSVVGEVNQAELLQALDAQMRQHPGLTDVEAFNQAVGIAHDEDVSTWVGAITQWMRTHNITTISLVQLQQAMAMPLIQLWLALLLGGYAIEQRGEFYDIEQIWIMGQLQPRF